MSIKRFIFLLRKSASIFVTKVVEPSWLAFALIMTGSFPPTLSHAQDVSTYLAIQDLVNRKSAMLATFYALHELEEGEVAYWTGQARTFGWVMIQPGSQDSGVPCKAYQLALYVYDNDGEFEDRQGCRSSSGEWGWGTEYFANIEIEEQSAPGQCRKLQVDVRLQTERFLLAGEACPFHASPGRWNVRLYY